MNTKVTALGATLCALVPLACGGSSQQSSSQKPPPPQTKAPTTQKTVGAPGAKVSFASPMNGSTQSSTVTAKVTISGFTLSPKTVGKPAKQGQGHLHFSMDNGKYDQPKYSGKNGQLAVKLGVNGKYSPSVTPSITYTGLPAGKHTLEVYLANNDHSNTGVEAKTTFTVKPGASGGTSSSSSGKSGGGGY
jgi:hypothetical protein